MKLLRLYISLILSVLAIYVDAELNFPAYSYDPDPITVTLEGRLAQARSARDSLILLENIYDLSQKYRPWLSDSIAEVIYHTARRAGDNYVALDMLRQRTSTNSLNDSVMNLMLTRARKFPQTPDTRGAVAFIKIMINSNAARNFADKWRDSIFNSELKQYTLTPPRDLYDRIVLLHSVCVNLAHETRGELLADYMEQLGDLIDRLPASEYAMRNVYHVQAALIFVEAGHPMDALVQDRKLLQNMDSMELNYARHGRPYRYYDSNRYVVYSRMLGNWEELTPAEIEDYYKKAIYYRDRDVRAFNAYKTAPRPDIYYALAHQDYVTALRLLKECVDNPRNKSSLRLFLKYMIVCADKLGDKDTLLEAYNRYFELLEEELSRRVQERYKELQVIYDVNGMQARYDELQNEKQAAENRMQHRVIVISLISIVLLLALIIFLVILYRRARRLTVKLTKANDDLQRESDSLRLSQKELTKARDHAERASNLKSDFIKNLSHEVAIPLKAISEYSHLIVDCSDFSGKPYLQRYSELIEDNSRLLNSIVADVLYLAEIDSDTLEIVKTPVDLYKAVTAAVDSAAPRLHKGGLKIIFDENSPQVDIDTDPRRLHQILYNLLSNGAKFTREGSVVVSYDLSKDGRSVVLSVADTGIGIPPEQAEHIFDRFAKLDNEAQGVGLGLTISRLLARLMGGDLRLDTSYTRGARFILTLPVQSK